MHPVELTDSQKDRFESIRADLSDSAGAYATVTDADVMDYVLELADAVEDPNPQQGDEPTSWPSDEPLRRPFPRERLREQLAERNSKHSDEDADKEMDLYSIAASYDVTGRGSMTKDELVEAILDTAERRYYDPFDQVDVEFRSTGSVDADASTDAEPNASASEEASTDAEPNASASEEANPDAEPNASASDEEAATHAEATEPETEGDDQIDTAVDDDGIETDDGGKTDTEAEPAEEGRMEAGDSDQLDAMLSLLETHEDKWWATDGEARYEVELPSGGTQTARTKDDVRAVLFKNY